MPRREWTIGLGGPWLSRRSRRMGRKGQIGMTKRNFILTLGLLLAITAFFGIRSALAQPEAAPLEQATPLHPNFALLDASGRNVLDTGAPVSTMQTCGECHNTEFIQKHAFHSDLGLSDYKENGGYNTST